MIYRLEKAVEEGMRIIKKEGEGYVKQKMYSTLMTSRLAIPSHSTPALARTGVYNTGLTPKEEGEFETLLGLDKGTLNNKSPFWHKFGVKIPAQGLTLNDSDPEDALTIALMKARVKTVGDMALTKQDLKTNANAKWLLTSTESEAEAITDSITLLAKAAIKFDSMNLEDMENYLKSKSIDPRGMSSKIVRGKVAEDVKSSPKKFLIIANDKDQSDKIFIHELVAYGVLRMSKNSYVNEDSVTVAYSQADLLEFIGNKINAKTVIAWKKQLEEYKK